VYRQEHWLHYAAPCIGVWKKLGRRRGRGERRRGRVDARGRQEEVRGGKGGRGKGQKR